MQILSRTAKKKTSDNNKGFIVTESGLVEDRGDRASSSARHKVKEHKSLLDSVTDSIKETSRRASVMPPGEKVQQQSPAAEKVDRRPSLNIVNVAAAKTQFGNLLSKTRSSSRYDKFNKFLFLTNISSSQNIPGSWDCSH